MILQWFWFSDFPFNFWLFAIGPPQPSIIIIIIIIIMHPPPLPTCSSSQMSLGAGKYQTFELKSSRQVQKLHLGPDSGLWPHELTIPLLCHCWCTPLGDRDEESSSRELFDSHLVTFKVEKSLPSNSRALLNSHHKCKKSKVRFRCFWTMISCDRFYQMLICAVIWTTLRRLFGLHFRTLLCCLFCLWSLHVVKVHLLGSSSTLDTWSKPLKFNNVTWD